MDERCPLPCPAGGLEHPPLFRTHQALSDLRELRNKFAHSGQARLSDVDFQEFRSKALRAVSKLFGRDDYESVRAIVDAPFLSMPLLIGQAVPLHSLERHSEICRVQLSRINLRFLPTPLSSRLSDFTFLLNHSSLSVAQDATNSLIGTVSGKAVSTGGSSISGDEFIQQLCDGASQRQRLLIAPAGFGKSTLLKQACIRVNQLAAENPYLMSHPVAFFVRAGSLSCLNSITGFR